MNKNTEVMTKVKLTELSSEELDMVSGGVPYADGRDYGGTGNALENALGSIGAAAAFLQIADA